MMNIWTKWVINLRHKKSQPDEDVGSSLTKYEVCQVNKISLDEYDKAKQ